MSVDWNKPVETVEGMPCRVISRDLDNSLYPVAVAGRFYEGSEWVKLYSLDGTTTEHCHTLRNVRKLRVGYVNATLHLTEVRGDHSYESVRMEVCGPVHESLETAKAHMQQECKCASGNEVVQVKLEWEE